MRGGFILQVYDDSRLQFAMKTRRDKFSKLSLKVQPYIIMVVGPNLQHIKMYYLVVNDFLYVHKNILDTVSALALKLNAECKHIWPFIQHISNNK